MTDLKRIDVTIDDANFQPGTLEVMKVLRPNWKEENIQFKIFTDGISNKIVGLYLGEDKQKMVLFRIYGKKTELLIDRQKEIETFQILFKVGCGPELYAAFNNGLAYEFVPGVILSTTSVKDEKVYNYHDHPYPQEDLWDYGPYQNNNNNAPTTIPMMPFNGGDVMPPFNTSGPNHHLMQAAGFPSSATPHQQQQQQQTVMAQFFDGHQFVPVQVMVEDNSPLYE